MKQQKSLKKTPMVMHHLAKRPDPRIFFRNDTDLVMKYLVAEANEEVSWLCTVERDGMDFYLDEVHIIEQEVHSAQTRMADDEKNNPIGKFFQDLIISGGAQKANAIRAWCHSHVNGPVNPSGTYSPGTYGDLSQMHQFGENGCDFMIMGIFNKSGDIRFDIYLYHEDIMYSFVPSFVYREERDDLLEWVKAELDEKVTSAPLVVRTPGYYGTYYSQHPPYRRPAGALASARYGNGTGEVYDLFDPEDYPIYEGPAVVIAPEDEFDWEEEEDD